jgi:nicotinamide-nucleotide amidase
VNIELLNTGSELMLGRVLNTNQQWLCRRLADLGYTVTRQVAVADHGTDIRQAVREALSRADVVVTTGGLGPTSDDVTREQAAELLGKPLREDASVLGHIENFFAVRNRPMPERNKAQALVPAGARVLWNPRGTAPGLALEVRPNPFREGGQASWLVLLPGPPRELRPMFEETVAPLLSDLFPEREIFVCRTLRTVGLGESAVQKKIAGPLNLLVAAGLEIGYCAGPGRVDVRLSARGPESTKLVQSAEQEARGILAAAVFVEGEDELEAVIVRLLTERRQTLAVAESCTGGCIAHRITNVPGASAVFLAGFVTYSDAAKQKFLGVRPETLARHGAVSEVVAREMAEGARRVTGADYALAVTGIAGPSGATPTKPVGTVFVSLATPTETTLEQNFNHFERETFKQVTAQQALNRLRLVLVHAR